MEYLKNNTILFILLAFLTNTSCTEKILTNDVQSLMLKGFVHSIEEEFYYASYSFDKLTLNEKLYTRYYAFDINGNFTEFMHANEFLRQQQPDTSLFINNNTINSSIINDTLLVTGDTTIWAKSSKQYDESGEKFTEPDYIRKKYKYLNDSIYLVSSFGKHGNILFYEDCRLNKNKLSVVKTYTNDDQLISKTDYTYDTKGRLISKTKYYEKTWYQTNYKYTTGKKYESDSYSAKHYVYSFNNSGLIKKQKNYIGNTHTSTLHYKYDKMENVIVIQEENEITKEKRESLFTYTYDSQNNWTQRIEKKYDGNIFVSSRKITYY